MRSKEPDPLLGHVLGGRYRVVKVIGKGGFGIVYLVEHIALEKPFALKLLYPHMVREGQYLQRFEREAKATCKIGHENIVDITDFGHDPQHGYYFVMELLQGETLFRRMKNEGPLQLHKVVHIGVQISDALAATHSKGVIHRDLKPENVFLSQRGATADFVKILDFGIAAINLDEEGMRLTQTGQIFGSPSYMSPEQALGLPLDPRSDIYSLGIILYEMTTGEVPFKGAAFLSILDKHRSEPPVPPSVLKPELDIHPVIEAIILKALEKKPETRCQTMGEMCQALLALSPSTAPSYSTQPPVGGQAHAARITGQQVSDTGQQVVGHPTPTPSGELMMLTVAKPRRSLGLGWIATIATLTALALAVVTYIVLLAVERREPQPGISQHVPSRASDTDIQGDEGEEQKPQTLSAVDKEDVTIDTPHIAAVQLADIVQESDVLVRIEVEEDTADSVDDQGTTATDEAMVLVEFRSQPRGARVYRDREYLGTTPFRIEMHKTPEELLFQFFKKGFYRKTVKRKISSPSKIRVVLKPRRRKPPEPPSRHKKDTYVIL